MNDKQWKRKNPIFKDLREKLHNFRVDDDVKVEIVAETAGAYDDRHLTGREIVTIILPGKFKGVDLPYRLGSNIQTSHCANPAEAIRFLRAANRANKEAEKKAEAERQASLALENKGGEIDAGQTDIN